MKKILKYIGTVLGIVASALIGGLCFTQSYVSFGLACRSVGLSVAYFFVKLAGHTPRFDVDTNKLPDKIDVKILPGTTEKFGERWTRFCEAFVTDRNARHYFTIFGIRSQRERSKPVCL